MQVTNEEHRLEVIIGCWVGIPLTPPVGRRRADALTGEAKYHHRVGQIKVSKWAIPEYQTHRFKTTYWE